MINTEPIFIAIEEGFTGPMLVKGFETGPNRVKVLLQWSLSHKSCAQTLSLLMLVEQIGGNQYKLSAVNVLLILTKRDVFKDDHLNFDNLITKV